MDKELENIENIEFKNKDCEDAALLVKKFCESLIVEKNYSDHTYRNYYNDLISFILWCDRIVVNPLKLQYRDIRRYLAEMDSAQYARSTINRRLSSLRSFYRWLDLIGKNTNNFAEVIKGPKILKTLPHVVRHDDMDKILDLCIDEIDKAETDKHKAIALRDYSIFELLYATGARISEIASLSLENINFDMSQIKFFGKGKKERIVPIYPLAASALSDYINIGRPILNLNNEKDLCFLGNSGKPMSADSIRKMFYKKLNDAGVHSDVSPHSIRHTFASDVLDGGADLRSVQEMLGHVSLSTTQIYTHLSTKKLKDVHTQAHPRG